ncbi:hypothetical protein, partial [Haemophilus influenzae]|uniref:hypothetical protein n=1 Tax=Haemophilus influenzae TaxID=727 RepID=UPI001952AB52
SKIAHAVACARPAWAIFERARPGDRRPNAASDAARAAGNAAGAAFLHPLAQATQVKHILESAAHAACAFAFAAGGHPAVGAHHIAPSRNLASAVVAEVLTRYPATPDGGGRVGEPMCQWDGLRGQMPTVAAQ